MSNSRAYKAEIIAAICVFSFAAYFFLSQPRAPQISHADSNVLAFPQNLAPASSLAVFTGTSSLARMTPAGTAEYRNTLYGFSLLYPKDLTVSTFDEGGGARTITFQNIVEVKGFQIFIVPYQGEQVSMARFHEDEPSGVMEQPTNILVGGTNATMFFSTNAALGNTIEVWVIKNGYLFEITAPKQSDVWLANIMQTWKFL